MKVYRSDCGSCCQVVLPCNVTRGRASFDCVWGDLRGIFLLSRTHAFLDEQSVWDAKHIQLNLTSLRMLPTLTVCLLNNLASTNEQGLLVAIAMSCPSTSHAAEETNSTNREDAGLDVPVL